MNENGGTTNSIEQSLLYKIHELVFHLDLIFDRTIVQKCLYMSAYFFRKLVIFGSTKTTFILYTTTTLSINI